MGKKQDVMMKMEKRGGFFKFSRNHNNDKAQAVPEPSACWTQDDVRKIGSEVVAALVFVFYISTLVSRWRRRRTTQKQPTPQQGVSLSQLNQELEDANKTIAQQKGQLHKFEKQLLRASRTNESSSNNNSETEKWKAEKEQLSKELEDAKKELEQLKNNITKKSLENQKEATAQVEPELIPVPTNAKLVQPTNQKPTQSMTVEELRHQNEQQQLRLEGLERLRHNDLSLIQKQQETIQQTKQDLEALRSKKNKKWWSRGKRESIVDDRSGSLATAELKELNSEVGCSTRTTVTALSDNHSYDESPHLQYPSEVA